MPLTAKWGGEGALSRIQKARVIASEALTAGFIQQTKFDEVKTLLNRAAEDSFVDGLNKHYLRIRTDATPFRGFYSEKGGEAYYATPQMHTLSGAVRKYAPHASGNPYLTDWVALAREWEPWGQVVAELKGKVAKRGDSRLQPATPKETRVNPNQIRATCACCFNGQAVTRNGKGMAHHGYTRPGLGRQTRSCPGVNYPPYELSNEGTKVILRTLENARDDQVAFLARLREGKQSVRTFRGVEYAPGSDGYEAVRHTAIGQTEYEIKSLGREIDALKGKVAGWQFIPVAGITG